MQVGPGLGSGQSGPAAFSPFGSIVRVLLKPRRDEADMGEEGSRKVWNCEGKSYLLGKTLGKLRSHFLLDPPEPKLSLPWECFLLTRINYINQ